MRSSTMRLATHPKLDLYLNIALDGYGETHDRIRGVPGNWEKTLDCIEALYPLKEKYDERFRLNVNTVVCADNYMEIEKLGEFMWSNFRLDGQYFNIIRGETLVGDEIKQVPPNVLPEMYAYISQLTKRYGDRMFADDDAQQRFVKNVAYVARSRPITELSTRTFEIDCLAIPVHGRRNNCRHRLQRRRARLRAAPEVCNSGGSRLRLRRAVGESGTNCWNSTRSTAARRVGARTFASFTTQCAIRGGRCSYELPKNYLTRENWQT